MNKLRNAMEIMPNAYLLLLLLNLYFNILLAFNKMPIPLAILFLI